MAQLDSTLRRVVLKVVYYGPAGAGKTANLKSLAAQLRDRHRGRLLSPDCDGGPTHFFDLLPVSLICAGTRVVLRLLSVPGDHMHTSTRRLVLRGADAVVFVADGTQDADANEAALGDLRTNLRDSGLLPESLPLVVQINKSDQAAQPPPPEGAPQKTVLPRTAWTTETARIAAVASAGLGVVETLCSAVGAAWDALERRQGLASSLGIECAHLTAELTRQFAQTDAALGLMRSAEPWPAPHGSPWPRREALRAIHTLPPDGGATRS